MLLSSSAFAYALGIEANSADTTIHEAPMYNPSLRMVILLILRSRQPKWAGGQSRVLVELFERDRLSLRASIATYANPEGGSSKTAFARGSSAYSLLTKRLTKWGPAMRCGR